VSYFRVSKWRLEVLIKCPLLIKSHQVLGKVSQSQNPSEKILETGTKVLWSTFLSEKSHNVEQKLISLRLSSSHVDVYSKNESKRWKQRNNLGVGTNLGDDGDVSVGVAGETSLSWRHSLRFLSIGTWQQVNRRRIRGSDTILIPENTNTN